MRLIGYKLFFSPGGKVAPLLSFTTSMRVGWVQYNPQPLGVGRQLYPSKKNLMEKIEGVGTSNQ